MDRLRSSNMNRRYTSSSIRDQDLEEKVPNIFGEIGVNVNECDIQACHQLREKGGTIVKFVNRKDRMNILRVKKDLKHLDPSKLSFSEGTKIFINESLCPYYRGTWNKARSLEQIKKCISFILLIGLFALTHMIDLVPDIEIDSL